MGSRTRLQAVLTGGRAVSRANGRAAHEAIAFKYSELHSPALDHHVRKTRIAAAVDYGVVE